MAAPRRIALPEASALEYRARAPKATLVLAHGAGAPQTHPFLVSVAEALAERGITVLTFNFPYAERGKGGPPIPSGSPLASLARKGPDKPAVLAAAFRAAIAAAPSDRPLFLGGKSMGGRLATELAAGLHGPLGVAIAGVAVLGYPLRPPGKPPRDTAHLLRLPCPLFVAQGTRDSFGGPDDLRPRLPPDAHLHIAEGGDHSFAVLKRSPIPQAETFAALVEDLAGWIAARATGSGTP